MSGVTRRAPEARPDAVQAPAPIRPLSTTARMIAWGGQPLGAAIAGGLAEFYGVRAALLVMGVGVAISLILGLAGPLRLPDRSRRGAPSRSG